MFSLAIYLVLNKCPPAPTCCSKLMTFQKINLKITHDDMMGYLILTGFMSVDYRYRYRKDRECMCSRIITLMALW